jgi:hypothetical protein
VKRLGRRWNWGLAWLVLRGRIVSIRVDVSFANRTAHTTVELTEEEARRWGH